MGLEKDDPWHEANHQDASKYLVLTGTWANRPGNPTVGQRYFATDRNLAYVYTGIANALWQTEVITPYPIVWRANQPFTATITGDVACATTTLYGGAYLQSVDVSIFQTNAPSGTVFVSWSGFWVQNNNVNVNLSMSGNDNKTGSAGVWFQPAPGIFGVSTANRILSNLVGMIDFFFTVNGATGNCLGQATFNLRGIG